MSAGTLEAVVQERDFYRGLLELRRHESIDALLPDILQILVQRTRAREAYIEVIADDGVIESSSAVSAGCAGPRIDEIKAIVSRGIIGEAMMHGKTVVTANAFEDPRFFERESVKRHRVESVLCAPLGRDAPMGVVYLQGRRDTDDFSPIDESTRRDVELLTGWVGPILQQLQAAQGAAASGYVRKPVDDGDPFAAVIGKSQALLDVVERLRFAAPLDIHVLLSGPSGAGKTLLANAVHRASKRSRGAFVELNCATLPDNLLENELFGADPGAHSAVPRGGTKGKVDAAEGGTLFLDEVAELSLGAQAKLLQLLQSKTYYRLGSTQQRHANVRILAATNVNLQAAVAERRFREDLYFRLKVLDVRVPSLAERRDDLLPLSAFFLRQAVQRHALSRKSFAPSAVLLIQTTEWNGNIRELEHAIESATLCAQIRGADSVERRDFFPGEKPLDETLGLTLHDAVRACQREHVDAALNSADWDVLAAAKQLDISRSQIYQLIREFELRRPD